jgi:hypothetical protein
MNRSRVIASALSTLLTFALITAVDPRAALAQPAGSSAPAQADSPEAATPQDLAKKLVNPLTDMVSVPLQFNWMNNVGPEKELRNVVYFQPVVPMSISKSWNLVGRWMMPYISQPSTYGGSSGLGDVMAQAFFAPKLKGTFSWGVGPMVSLPISSDFTLGYGQWAAGPTGAVMKQSGGMTYGLLMNNIWSFAKTGTADRPGINMGYIQPVIAHTSRNGVTVSLSTETIVNWKANTDDRWSVPITTAVSKIVKFGMYPMSVQLGGGYYVVRPENGPNWQLRTTFTLLMPRR